MRGDRCNYLIGNKTLYVGTQTPHNFSQVLEQKQKHHSGQRQSEAQLIRITPRPEARGGNTGKTLSPLGRSKLVDWRPAFRRNSSGTASSSSPSPLWIFKGDSLVRIQFLAEKECRQHSLGGYLCILIRRNTTDMHSLGAHASDIQNQNPVVHKLCPNIYHPPLGQNSEN